MSKIKSIFLGGPIQYAIQEDGSFNEGIKSMLNHIISNINKSGNKVFSAHIAEDFGASTHNQSCEEICLRDYNWMKSCNVYIAILPHDNSNNYVRSDGTYVEIGWASALNKPIIFISDKSMINKLSMLVSGLHAINAVQYLDINKVISNPQVIKDSIKSILQQSKKIVEI